MTFNIKQQSGSKTVISAEKGKISLVLNSDLSVERKQAFMDIVDEILDDLQGHDFKGKFSFIGDTIQITLETPKDKKTWTKEV